MAILHARKNLRLYVSRRQEEILTGCILGDAYITKRGQIVIEQGIPQKEYLLWKYEELRTLAYPSVRPIKRLDKRNNQIYQSVCFNLRQYFRPWRDKFYPQGYKIFPDAIRVTSLTLAVWYMDDGCWSGNRCFLCIDGFNQNDREKIKVLLFDHFGIETIIRTNGKLLIRRKSQNLFFFLIGPYIVPSMSYKIIDPVTTDRILSKSVREIGIFDPLSHADASDFDRRMMV